METTIWQTYQNDGVIMLGIINTSNQNQINSFAEPFQVYRIYTPIGEPYINSYILNENVYVPVGFGQWDDEALEVFQEALPGYTIRGYYDYSYINTDALNCRVMNIPDFEAIRIIHNSVNNQPYPMDEYPVSAFFIDLSDNGILMESLNIYWKNQFMQDYENLPMTLGGNPEEYSAIIPEQPGDTPVHYYIEGGNITGRVDRLPIAGYFEFYAFIGSDHSFGMASNWTIHIKIQVETKSKKFCIVCLQKPRFFAQNVKHGGPQIGSDYQKTIHGTLSSRNGGLPPRFDFSRVRVAFSGLLAFTFGFS